TGVTSQVVSGRLRPVSDPLRALSYQPPRAAAQARPSAAGPMGRAGAARRARGSGPEGTVFDTIRGCVLLRGSAAVGPAGPRRAADLERPAAPGGARRRTAAPGGARRRPADRSRQAGVEGRWRSRPVRVGP